MNQLSLVAGTAILAHSFTFHAVAAETPQDLLKQFAGSTITVVVPFPPGAAADTTGRLVAEALGKELNATVIVQNLPGATGTIGAAAVARAAGDGKTLLFGVTASQIIAPQLLKALPYDAANAFTPIARVTSGGQLILANPSFPANNIQEMIEIAKTSHDPLTYGSWGHGSGGHLAFEAIVQESGIELTHVPYKGATPMYQDVIGGHLILSAGDLGTAWTHVKEGRVKALAATGTKRSALFPDLPTLQEQGLNFGVDNWTAIFAPASMSADLAEALHEVTRKAIETPAVQELLVKQGTEYSPVTREEFMAQYGGDEVIWRQIIETGNIAID